MDLKYPYPDPLIRGTDPDPDSDLYPCSKTFGIFFKAFLGTNRYYRET